MPAAGSEVAVAFKAQTALGTAATGADAVLIKHTRFGEGPGPVTDAGEPEIGGSLHQIAELAVYGYSPNLRGSGRLRIPTSAETLLLAAGYKISIGSTYVPATANADIGYYTVGVKYNEEGLTDAHIQLQDVRLGNLTLDHQPRRAPTFQYAGLGANHGASTLTGVAPADIVPSPVAAIPSANSTFFGVAGFKCYGFSWIIENTLFNDRQPLGQITPDDVVVTSISTRAVFVIKVTKDNINRVYYGDPANTAISAVLEAGALNMRLTEAGSGAGLDSIEYAISDAQYTIEQEIDFGATDEVFLVVAARPRTGSTTSVTFAVSV